MDIQLKNKKDFFEHFGLKENVNKTCLSYAGIGSRDIPDWVAHCMKSSAMWLGKRNYILRSGRAGGSDMAFEKGAISINAKTELYIPWNGFGPNDGRGINVTNKEIIRKASEIAEYFHPKWSACSQGAKKLMMRNCFQVLGSNLNTSSKFIICYTKDGKMIGGTSQALRIAKVLGIPIFNFGNYKNISEARIGFAQFRKEVIGL